MFKIRTNIPVNKHIIPHVEPPVKVRGPLFNLSGSNVSWAERKVPVISRLNLWNRFNVPPKSGIGVVAGVVGGVVAGVVGVTGVGGAGNFQDRLNAQTPAGNFRRGGFINRMPPQMLESMLSDPDVLSRVQEAIGNIQNQQAQQGTGQ